MAKSYNFHFHKNDFTSPLSANGLFRDLVRKWHHNSDDSTDIIFRLILSVLYFSLISSCVIHHLLWHLFFAAQFQGQMIGFHY